ncbi:MAG: HTH domain-containing protein [Candidatus Kapabacteria bacterium]|nr:HTH domain-containing protein [Candidatus Kapabacteria bacterium]
MAKTSFWDIIEKTIEKVGTPLSAKEIWEKANELGTLGDFSTTGKTPWATIAAYCYTDINKNGDNSIIIQTSERPAQFFLRRLAKKIDIHKAQNQKDTKITKKEKLETKKFNERDLHPLLVAYAFGDSHFKANLKTIFHEYSSKATKGQNEWLHPDLVGVYFPFRDYKPETLEIQNHLSITSIKLFSFELKVSLNFGNLRQSYFQAVSNSSWANEGYLVTLYIDDDPTFKDEVRRLNNAFGIGIIRLNPENIFESEILFPSRINQEIDWDSVNRLANENSDFNDFLKLITEDCKLGKVKSQYDKVMKMEELTKYIKDKGINNAE